MARSISSEEVDLMADPKYRNFMSQMDKALKGFESTSEWADLVNALGKLNKVRHTIVWILYLWFLYHRLVLFGLVLFFFVVVFIHRLDFVPLNDT